MSLLSGLMNIARYAELYLKCCMLHQVLTALRQHALNLWIHLSPKANFTECVKIAANLSSFVDQIPHNPNSTDEIIEAGVGFGNNIWSLVCRNIR